MITGKRKLSQDSLTRLLQVSSTHPIKVKKTVDSFDKVFDYMVKVEDMSEEEKKVHNRYEEKKLKRNLGLHYVDNLLRTGEGLIAEVMMTEEDWEEGRQGGNID